jgi:hypothetical protein
MISSEYAHRGSAHRSFGTSPAVRAGQVAHRTSRPIPARCPSRDARSRHWLEQTGVVPDDAARCFDYEPVDLEGPASHFVTVSSAASALSGIGKTTDPSAGRGSPERCPLAAPEDPHRAPFVFRGWKNGGPWMHPMGVRARSSPHSSASSTRVPADNPAASVEHHQLAPLSRHCDA